MLDEGGKVVRWPAKRNRHVRPAILAYLAEKFENGRIYTEREVNDILKSWHTFDDHALLRRELVDQGHFGRELDGSRYWLIEKTAD